MHGQDHWQVESVVGCFIRHQRIVIGHREGGHIVAGRDQIQ